MAVDGFLQDTRAFRSREVAHMAAKSGGGSDCVWKVSGVKLGLKTGSEPTEWNLKVAKCFISGRLSVL